MNFRTFHYYLLGGWLIYLLMLPLVIYFKIYESFPGIAIVGYGAMIASQVIAVRYTQRASDDILVSISLIIIGAIASQCLFYGLKRGKE